MRGDGFKEDNDLDGLHDYVGRYAKLIPKASMR